jgi:hypothetical protein
MNALQWLAEHLFGVRRCIQQLGAAKLAGTALAVGRSVQQTSMVSSTLLAMLMP